MNSQFDAGNPNSKDVHRHKSVAKKLSGTKGVLSEKVSAATNVTRKTLIASKKNISQKAKIVSGGYPIAKMEI